jgi:hypothetical protein
MDNQSTDRGISALMNQIDTLILQHLNYLNRLEEACKTKQTFPHKLPTDCNFGKLFYSEVWPMRDSLSVDFRRMVEDVEGTHRKFHATTAVIDPLNTQQAELDPTVACMLILKLYSLERAVKSTVK